MFKKIKDIFSFKQPKNPQEAQKLLDSANANKFTMNVAKIIGTDEGLESLNIWVDAQYKIAEGYAKKYKIKNTAKPYLLNDTRDKVKDLAMNKVMRTLKSTAKSTIKFAKSVPSTLKATYNKVASDLNVYGRYKEALNSRLTFQDIKITKPYNPQTQYIEDGQIKAIPKNWQEYLNTPKDFSKLQSSKLDELKTPTVQGVGNNTALVDNSELLVKYPTPTVNTSTNWLSTLGQIFSTTASLLGLVGGVVGGLKPSVGGSLGGSINGVEYPSIKFPIKQHHTGGKISGRDEVLAILRGGETVRTETQENELQQEKFKEFMKEFAPVVSGEEDEANPYQQLLGGQKNKKNPKLPVLLEKTRQDEELIISIIADAWKCNRLGFRNILRYE